jgi:hypothetical protein
LPIVIIEENATTLAIKTDGTVLVVSQQILKLSDDADPTIFLDQPSCMMKMLPDKRKNPEISH